MKYDVPEGTAETGKYAYWNSSYVTAVERYTKINEFWFWVSSDSDRLRVQVFRATGADPNNWVTEFNTDFGLEGWSGSDWIRCSGQTFGGSKTQTGNYWNWRIIFWSRMKDGSSAFTADTVQSIYGINGYGENVWTPANPLMKEDHLYSWDVDQNATFPANVKATSFTGNLTGNATGVSHYGAVSDSTARHVWFSHSATEAKRVYDDNFKYTPSTNTVSANISGSSVEVTTQGAASDSTARHVWFSDSTTETKRAHDDGLKYTPSTNTITANVSGNAATASNAPTSASIDSSGLITYKDSSGNSLFTLQLPLYNGGTT